MEKGSFEQVTSMFLSLSLQSTKTYLKLKQAYNNNKNTPQQCQHDDRWLLTQASVSGTQEVVGDVDPMLPANQIVPQKPDISMFR